MCKNLLIAKSRSIFCKSAVLHFTQTSVLLLQEHISVFALLIFPCAILVGVGSHPSDQPNEEEGEKKGGGVWRENGSLLRDVTTKVSMK